MGATLVLPKKNEWCWTASLIKTLRGKRSLAEFAELLGVPKKTVGQWEANRGPALDAASVRKLSALARKEGFHSDWKLKGSVAWVADDLGTGERLINKLIRESLERTAREL